MVIRVHKPSGDYKRVHIENSDCPFISAVGGTDITKVVYKEMPLRYQLSSVLQEIPKTFQNRRVCNANRLDVSRLV